MLNFLKRVLNFLFRSKKRYPKNIGKKVIISKDCTFSHPENVIINDYVYIGPRARVSSFGKVVFGKGVIIGPDLVIHTANHNYQNDIKTIPYDVGLNIKDVYIDEAVWIGSNVIILPGVKIGKGSVVATGSVITKDVLDYSIIGGNPAKLIKMRDNIEVFNKHFESENYYIKQKLD
ncbi:acyltransferase [Dokdonia ponticola]|uniref:Acyltransferase n=1 Tax=Dokdonia ponticola TaxID=2041041 RepID=A0ABV9HTL9_9FLAO